MIRRRSNGFAISNDRRGSDVSDVRNDIEYYGDGDTLAWLLFHSICFRFAAPLTHSVVVNDAGEVLSLDGVADLCGVSADPYGEERWNVEPFVLRDEGGIERDSPRTCAPFTIYRGDAVEAQVMPYDRPDLEDWPKNFRGRLRCQRTGENNFTVEGSLVLPEYSFNEVRRWTPRASSSRLVITAESPDIGREHGQPVWHLGQRPLLRLSSLVIKTDSNGLLA